MRLQRGACRRSRPSRWFGRLLGGGGGLAGPAAAKVAAVGRRGDDRRPAAPRVGPTRLGLGHAPTPRISAPAPFRASARSARRRPTERSGAPRRHIGPASCAVSTHESASGVEGGAPARTSGDLRRRESSSDTELEHERLGRPGPARRLPMDPRARHADGTATPRPAPQLAATARATTARTTPVRATERHAKRLTSGPRGILPSLGAADDDSHPSTDGLCRPGPARNAGLRRRVRCGRSGSSSASTRCRESPRRRSGSSAKLGLATVRDVLEHRPRRYETAADEVAIAELRAGRGGAWSAAACSTSRSGRCAARRTRIVARVDDGTAAVSVTWFNQPWLADRLKPGTEVRLRGKLGRYGFEPRSYDIGDGTRATADFAPVYPAAEEIAAVTVRRVVDARSRSRRTSPIRCPPSCASARGWR